MKLTLINRVIKLENAQVGDCVLDQKAIDRFIHNLNKIYGDGQEAESICPAQFMEMTQESLKRVYGEIEPKPLK
jgi:hypothetical protein